MLAAWLGLLGLVCAGQDAAQQNQPAPSQSSPDQSSPNQSSSHDQDQSPQGQPPLNQQPQNQDPKKATPSKPTPQNQYSPERSPIALDSSETLFAVLTALNSCGYDQDLTISDATRSNVRAEVQRVLAESADAEAARSALCEFYLTHTAERSSNRSLSPYISLALYMDGPPHFAPRIKEEDLPPDASAIATFGTLLERFYEKVGVHSIWERHRRDYAAMMARYHEPLAKMVFDTEIYLKQPSSQYLGRRFTIYLDFMGSPNETDARNYGADYYVIVFPAPNMPSGDAPKSALKMDQIRHTFLHYELDREAEKHFTAIKRLEPLLQSVKRAPLEESFKTDISLLVTECLVRAVEIRTTGSKAAEAMRTQAVEDAVKQGYILTRTFYDEVAAFEKDPVGIRGVYGDFLENIDVKKEEKAAAEIQFASATAPELVRLSRPEERRMLVAAEKRLAAGDPKGAQELAQQALDKKIGDQGRALFILAEVAVATKNRDGAQDSFRKAIEATR